MRLPLAVGFKECGSSFLERGLACKLHAARPAVALCCQQILTRHTIAQGAAASGHVTAERLAGCTPATPQGPGVMQSPVHLAAQTLNLHTAEGLAGWLHVPPGSPLRLCCCCCPQTPTRQALSLKTTVSLCVPAERLAGWLHAPAGMPSSHSCCRRLLLLPPMYPSNPNHSTSLRAC